MNSENNSKKSRLFGGVLIVLFAIVSGVFLGSWFVNMKPQNASADLDYTIADNYTYGSPSFQFSKWFGYSSSSCSYGVTFDVSPTLTINYSSGNNMFVSSDFNVTSFVLGANKNYDLVNYYRNAGAGFNSYYVQVSGANWTNSRYILNDTELQGYTEVYSSSGSGSRTYINSIWMAFSYKHGSADGFGQINYISYGYMSKADLISYNDVFCDNSLFGSSYVNTCFYLSFVDFNQCSLSYIFAVDYVPEFALTFGHNNIYTPNANQSSIDYSSGYNQGVSDGQQTGFNSGYQSGYNVGLNVGYNNGVLDSNDYSFLGLMGAVVDVPVRSFTSLFNFDILGVNLKDFLLGLFGISVVITILRFVMVK